MAELTKKPLIRPTVSKTIPIVGFANACCLGNHTTDKGTQFAGFSNIITINGNVVINAYQCTGVKVERLELMSVLSLMHHVTKITNAGYIYPMTINVRANGYVHDVLERHLNHWLENGFINRNKQPIADADLWKVFMNMQMPDKIKMEWRYGGASEWQSIGTALAYKMAYKRLYDSSMDVEQGKIIKRKLQSLQDIIGPYQFVNLVMKDLPYPVTG